MAGAVSRLPEPPPSNGDGVPPADVYKIAVEEYRFQATFNWSRTQYLLAFNTGILPQRRRSRHGPVEVPPSSSLSVPSPACCPCSS